MSEEMNKIKDYLKENGCVSLAKQCKQEYIIYSYFLNNESRDKGFPCCPTCRKSVSEEDDFCPNCFQALEW